MLELIELDYKSDNPFNQFPELYSIWEPDLAVIAKEAIDETFELMRVYPDADIGTIYLIKLESKTIGISGYFPNNPEFSEFVLRWHGILPEYQGKGYSDAILKHIEAHLTTTYPEAKLLVEMMPTESPLLEDYFIKCGFKPRGAPVAYEWSERYWQEYYKTIG